MRFDVFCIIRASFFVLSIEFALFLGFIFNDFLDRPLGDNVIFTAASVQPKKKDSQVPESVRFVLNDLPSMFVHVFHQFCTILGIIFLYLFDIDLGIEFNRFEAKMAPQIYPFSKVSGPKTSKNRIPRIGQSFREAFC